jgi:hypothetical protein
MKTETNDGCLAVQQGADDNETTNRLATSWWTPQGFVRREMPPAFRAFLENGNDDDWERGLADAGHEKRHLFSNGKFPGLEIRIYRHWLGMESHLYVAVGDTNDGSSGYRCLSEFFVSERDVNAFFASWYVAFVRSAAQSEQAESIARIAKTLVAFVRHGHGTDTIDEYGEES